ncbi:Glycosyl transferases group 1 [Paracoccus isoporae]|uniref:Glycosyl transferases group 1 n=2 Tax=Paracoccus isoporae TaxID=591205 RepID=A0A1G6Z582_9RHOB|nr:Glycosyl transferases group 1 [Paracoccus isoporae]
MLDVSRLVSRIGTGPLTGIDRVEAAWLRHLAGRAHLLLCRIGRGQALLPAEDGPRILKWIGGDLSTLPARAGWRDAAGGRGSASARARTALRRSALAVTRPSGRGLIRHVRHHLPGCVAYLNLGHSNLHRDLLNNLNGLRRVVMIHDTIPLDHPEFTRDGQSEKFRARFVSALSLADLIVAISDATADCIAHWQKRLAIPRQPEVIVARIGTDLAAPDEGQLPAGLDVTTPFFVTIGTIEPRKNHAVLLDAWEILAQRLPADRMPRLFIIGRRGWSNEALFARLDRLPSDSAVMECAGLSDAAVASLLSRCNGLLMPSRAEGFGLPLTEAAGRGVPILCTDLPSSRELLGPYPTYLSPDRPAQWADSVATLCGIQPSRAQSLAIPDWKLHFKSIDNALS